ncbi:MAG: cation:dicarboxylase symporter family transporter [Robiginitomaculum sp.]
MFSKFHETSLLLLVFIAAMLAVGLYILGASFLAAPISMGDVTISKSLAGLAKDSLFKPLKPLMYALIIMSIGSSIAISRGGLGAKFIRILSFMLLFSVIGAIVAIIAFNLFPSISIFPEASSVALASGKKIMQIPFTVKMYGVLTSPLMISIYAGVLLGGALTRAGLGRDADKVSDIFMNGFRKFLQFTIPLAVFGSITLALNAEGGVDKFKALLPLVPVYVGGMIIVWIIMIAATTVILKQSVGFLMRALLPQALVALSTSSSIATLPATKIACDDMGANGDESTPFITIGATINMVGTMMSLLLLSLYAMKAYGIDASIGDQIVVGMQSLLYSAATAAVPSASIVLLQEILTSQSVSAEYATYVTGLIITLDTLVLDRVRTMLNTQSDSMSTVNGLHTYYKRPAILPD